MDKQFYVYILTNKSGTLYIGITNNLIRRGYEHKETVMERSKNDSSRDFNFTAKYYIDKLVYFEVFSDAENAIAREKQLKGSTRKKKFALIRSRNPAFKDLYPNIIQ